MNSKNPFSDVYGSEYYRHPHGHNLAKFPLILDLEPTNLCNLDCLMCSRQLMKRPVGKMEFGLFKKIADEAAKEGCKGIRLIRFGEPLLHEGIFDIVGYASGKGLLTHITTNGLLLDEEKIGRIFESGLDSIIFSFQGVDRKGYALMRNNQQYEMLEESIKALAGERKKRGLEKPFIQVTTTVLDETEEEIKGFYGKWRGVADKVDHWFTSLERLEDVERAKPLFERQKVKEMLAERENETGRMGRCNEVLTKLSVSWDGIVTACCGDYDNFLEVGNFKESSLKEIWNCKKLNYLREVLGRGEREKIPFCAKCTSKF